MFIAHFGAGFGGKRFASAVSLGTLFLAAQFLDLIWPTMLLLGVEEVAIAPGITRVNPIDFTNYPISHSLLTVCGWGLMLGLAYWLIRRRPRAAVVVGLLVVSHWLLDLVVHRPDLPLYPGDSPRVGLGLWNSVAATLLAEGLLFAAGLALYLRATRARDRAGSVGLWVLVGLLLVIQAGSLFGPLPERPADVAWVSQLQWLLVGLAYWLDRHREARRPASERQRPGRLVYARGG